MDDPLNMRPARAWDTNNLAFQLRKRPVHRLRGVIDSDPTANKAVSVRGNVKLRGVADSMSYEKSIGVGRPIDLAIKLRKGSLGGQSAVQAG